MCRFERNQLNQLRWKLIFTAIFPDNLYQYGNNINVSNKSGKEKSISDISNRLPYPSAVFSKLRSQKYISPVI